MFGDLEGQFFLSCIVIQTLMLAKVLLLEFKKLSSKGKCFDINKILPTNFLRDCMEIILEKLYVDNGA